jgi:sortase A
MIQQDWQRSEDFTWLELVALLATCLIWAGVGLMSVGLYLAYRDLQSGIQVLAAGGSPNQHIVLAVTAIPTPTPLSPTATAIPPTQEPAYLPESPGLTATATEETPAAGAPTAIATATARNGRTKHVVAAGESLWSIATQYGVPVEALLAANGLSREAVLHPGDELIIPAPGEAVPPPTPSPPPAPTDTPAAPVPISVPTEPPPGPTEDSPEQKGTPPTRLVIPAINLDAPVVPVSWKTEEENGRSYTVWEVADYAVGWHKTSAYPGQVGNTVLAGHHNIKGEVFRYLVNLETGDEVQLYAGEELHRYIVTEKLILREKDMPEEVRLQNAHWIAATQDERLTMVTCWPYTNNTHRVVVVAKPVTK